MPAPAAFAAKLDLVLKTLSMSRGRLAADLGVDKSLVGRWASGAVAPSAHNLANLTRLVASRREGFTMLDWDRSLPSLAGLFGVQVETVQTEAPAAAESPLQGLPKPFLEMATFTTGRRGSAYEGFWRTTRPSVVMPGVFFHDHGMIRVEAGGLLRVRMGASGLMFEGWMLPGEGQLFVILFDAAGETPIFLIFNGVPLPKAAMLDGLVLAASLNAARTPAAYPIVLERIGDLSGDHDADEARCQELLASDPVAPTETIPDDLRNHLVRDIGPAAAAAGGDLLLLAPMTATFSRGASFGGHLQG